MHYIIPSILILSGVLLLAGGIAVMIADMEPK